MGKGLTFFDRLKFLFNAESISEYVKKFFAGDDLPESEMAIDEDVALKYSAVFACCRILAETFASTPLHEYKKIDNDNREKTNDTGLYDVLHNVSNSEMSAYNFHELAMYQLCLWGNFLAKKVQNRVGEIIQLYPYNWEKVTPDRDEKEKLYYKIKKNDGIEEVKKYRKDVFHVVGNSLNGVVGMSPITYTAKAIQLGLTYEIYGINFYKKGAFPSGNFKHPQFLKPEAYERLKKDIKTNYTSLQNAGTPMLLEDGLEYQPLSINPVDAQLIESKKFQIEDVARIYRVPLHLLQNLDKATNNNIEHQSLEFVMYTMLPHYKRYESTINSQLLNKNQRNDGYYYEFNVGGLLRGDQKSMAEAFATGRQWGWLSVNDIRRMLNLNPIDNGDIYLQPLNMIEAGSKQFEDQKKQILDQVYKLLENTGKD